MASATTEAGTVTGTVDAQGRLIAADPPLAQLQAAAGSRIGARLAVPQIAAVARLARDVGVPVARAVMAASDGHDLDLWVRATLAGEHVELTIDGWRSRASAAPRLDLLLSADELTGEDHAPALGQWATDAGLNITALSPDLAARLGIDTDEGNGRPLTSLLHLEENKNGELPVLAALAARTSFVDQRASPRAGGSRLLLSAEVVQDASGEFAGLIGRAVPDRDGLVAVPEARAGAVTMARDIDEALGTPLDRIIAAADRIVDRSDGPLRGDYAAYADDIAAAGRHLLSVVRAMAEGADAPADSVDLVAAASEAVSLVASAGTAKRVAVDVMASSRVQARGAKRGIVQIIVNILGNAIRHSPPDTAVTIAIGAQDGRALITISDKGPGIAAADQQRIYQRFERLGATDSGTGLGLAIARRLAEEMDGWIDLESAPGEGAHFTINLPIA